MYRDYVAVCMVLVWISFLMDGADDIGYAFLDARTNVDLLSAVDEI